MSVSGFLECGFAFVIVAFLGFCIFYFYFVPLQEEREFVQTKKKKEERGKVVLH